MIEAQLVPLWYNSKSKKFRYARTTTAEENKGIAESVQTRIAQEFPESIGFKGYFKYNPQTGENEGSYIFLGILINQEWARKSNNQLWLPGVKEFKVLDKFEKLTNGVYRDIGAVLYSVDSPNEEFAKSIRVQMKGREFPIVFPSFKAFDLKKGENSYGINLIASKNNPEILSGEKAQKFLEANFPFRAKSGFLRLCRGGGGGCGWYADWHGRLGDSGSVGRVGDFVCGEATAENLEQMVRDIDDTRIEVLRQTQKARLAEFQKSLKALI